MFLIYLWPIIIYSGDTWDKIKNFKADGKLPGKGLSSRMKGWRPTWPLLLTPQGKCRYEVKVHISENIRHLKVPFLLTPLPVQILQRWVIPTNTSQSPTIHLEKVLYIYLPLENVKAWKTSGWAEYRRVLDIHWLSLFRRDFPFSF